MQHEDLIYRLHAAAAEHGTVDGAPPDRSVLLQEAADALEAQPRNNEEALAYQLPELSTARPIYSIRVEDMISHVEWTLDGEDEEVTFGRVELDRYADRPPVSQIGMAFARAWQEANQERVRRLLEDLDGLQEEIEVERRQFAGDFVHHADDGCEEVAQ